MDFIFAVMLSICLVIQIQDTFLFTGALLPLPKCQTQFSLARAKMTVMLLLLMSNFLK